MRTDTEQFDGLLHLARTIGKDWTHIRKFDGDVMCFYAGRYEATYVVEGYDIWLNGEPVRFGLTVNEAAQAMRDGGV